VGNPAIKSGAQPVNDDDFLRAAERAVFAAMLDDARGERRADAGQAHQFFSRCSVDVDLFLGKRRREQQTAGQKQQAATQQKFCDAPAWRNVQSAICNLQSAI
jgi:hypothetical protein